jgi:F0F1-type ATP synthase membrane subunit b/b'
MKKFLIYAIVLIAVIAMAKTVPDKKAHKKAMMEAVKAYVDEEASERGMGDNILTDLGKGIVNKTIEVALNSKLEVDNYLIFNTTHVELDDETQVLSLGALGHVFTFDKQMLRDALEASAKEKAEKKSERKAAKEAAKEARKLEKQQRKEEKRREKQAQKERKKAIKQAKKIRKSVEKEIERQNSDD